MGDAYEPSHLLWKHDGVFEEGNGGRIVDPGGEACRAIPNTGFLGNEEGPSVW